jgi:hypothetical protein
MNTDPTLHSVRHLARIHPLDLVGLMAQSREILDRASGLGLGHPIFHPFYAVQTPDDLARINWEEVANNLQFQASLHAEFCQSTLLSVRLLADRALLHRQLYRSRSASTLKLLGQCALPLCAMPLELLALCEQFDRSMCEADRALHAGRTVLDRFQDQALQGGAWETLCSLLDQAQACYQGYQQALQRACELRDYIERHLADEPTTVVPSPYAA